MIDQTAEAPALDPGPEFAAAAEVEAATPIAGGAGGGDATDAPVNAAGEKRKPSTDPAGPTAEEVSEYDAETVRLIGGAEARVIQAECELSAAKSAAKLARENVKMAAAALRELIRERAEGRGKEPEKTLLDFAKPAPAKWRGYDLDTIAIHRDVKRVLAEANIRTLGELHEQVGAQWDAATGPPLGLTMNETAELRERVQAIIDAEFNATAEAGEYGAGEPIPENLWREYPLSRWVRFGVTAKDVEKMAAGEVKRETGRRPLATVGDLSDFSTPTGSGYTRGYGDIKGIGNGGADRISEAETRFWAWWKGGGETEFARERGLIRENPAGHPRGDASERGDDRAGPGDAVMSEPATADEFAADAEARNRVDTPGEAYDRGQTDGW